jgi:hypothetical protein
MGTRHVACMGVKINEYKILMIKFRRVRHIACMVEKRNAYELLARKLEGKRPL